MPRKRHDTSDEDSDVSIGDKRGKAKKSAPALNKKQRDSKASKRNVSESSSDTSPVKRKATDSKKGTGKRKKESESDSSPVKRSVQSRIHKPSDENRYVRPTSRENRSDARSISGSDASPDKRRKGPVGSPQGPRQRNDNIDHFRSRSPDLRQRSLDRFSRRDDRLDLFDDRNNYRGRNLDFDRRDRDMMMQPMDGRPVRDRSADIRDRHFAFEDREREEYMDRSQHFGQRAEFDIRDRDIMRGPLSPERGTRRNDRLSPERRRGRDRLDSFSYEQRNDFFERDPRLLRRQSLSPVRRNDRQYQKSPQPISDSFGDARRSPSFERGSRRQRNRQSLSPENLTRRNHFENNVSPDRLHRVENILDSKRSPEVKTKSGKSGKKKKNKKENEEKLSGPKSRGERQERSESLERSFERSKQSLIIPEDDGETQSKKNTSSKKETKKSSKKNTSKRPRSSSGSPQRGKKSKENESSEPVQEKKGKKKGKKEKSSKLESQASRSRSPSADSLTLKRSSKKHKSFTKPIKNSLSRRSHSRSNSPQERSIRSSGLDRSRSLDKSFGRKHDMTKFESEPESGEITDSDEEGKNALKSQVNKPLDEAEEKKQQEEDERYWNEKRRASRKREEELTKQPTSRSSKEDNRKENSGKRNRTSDEVKVNDQKVDSDTAPPAKKPRAEGTEILTGRTGGAYIPPARLRAMQASITDKSSVEYQRISWEALKKSINGLVNKVNVSNIENIVRELFQENIVRGRGLFARSIIQAQSASPTFTHVYAALVSIVNTKFPQNGELVLRRLIIQFRRGYKRNDKTICLSATRFVAHLVNQQVAHEVLSLEILTLLLEEPTDDSVEVAIGFLKECGQKLTDVSPRGINAIFERLRTILHESQIDKRVQYMIEVMFAVRKDQFKDYPALVEELDLVEEEDQFTHLLTLEDAGNGEELLNVFRPDPAFEENEEKYKILKKEILGEGSSDEEDGDASGGDDDDDDSSEGNEEEDEEKKQTVIDNTETNMVALRRTIYLTIQSSLDFEECAHKLMKMDLKPGQEIELCNMILDCCAQMRTYEKFFGLLAGRFCMIDKKYVEPFQNMFKEQYDTIHRLETNKLRNVAKFFSHLLYTDSISWAVLSCIKLNEEDTTSASRIFIKILFQELSEYMGLPKLNERLKDPTLMEYFVGLMPRDNPRDTRFAINFFTTIGLGGLTDDLREHLKDVSKKLMQQKQEEQEKAAASEDSSDSSDSDTESSSGSSSDTDSSSDSESSEDDKARKRKQKESEKQKKKEKKKGKEGKERSSHQKEKQREKDVREKDKDKNAQTKVRKDKKGKKKQLSDVEQQKERDKQFKRLARLANYDEEIIDPNARNKRSIDREDRVRKGQENGDRRDRRRNIDERDFDKGQRRNNDFDHEEFDDDRYIHEREKGFDRDLYTERGFDRTYDSGYDREDRFDSIDKRKSGKRGKGYVDIDRHDPSIRVERNFERMDIYEEKFERDRARNLEFVRRRPEFEDYYEGRNEDSRMRGQDREGRRREVEDPGFDARQYRDRTVKDDRRRNRSEERIPRDAGRRRR